jgi:hypothetical protein
MTASMKTLVIKLRDIAQHPLAPLIALFGLALLSYGIYVTWMGFYWDDWPISWLSHISDADSIKYFQFQRPLSGLVIYIGNKIFGEVPLNWQIFTFLLRYGSAVAAWWLIRTIWPTENVRAFMVAALFLVFPGFSQQFVSVNSAPHLVALILFLVSVTLMVTAERTAAPWGLRAAALASALLAMLTSDYFHGLELARPFILWLALDGKKKSVRSVALAWLPYLALLIAVLAWHSYISRYGAYSLDLLDAIRANPLPALQQFIGTVLTDFRVATWDVWVRTFALPSANLIGQSGVRYFWLLAAAALAGTATFLFLQNSRNKDRRWSMEAIALGAIMLLGGGIVFWIPQLPFSLSFPSDRLALPMMLGSSLLLAGLIDYAIKSRAIQAIVFSIFIGLAVGLHFLNALAFRIDWQSQITFLNQLAWRVPGLTHATTLVSEELPFAHESDNSMAAPINWMYAPDLDPPAEYYDWEYRIENFIDLPYMVRYLDLRISGGHMPSLEEAAEYEATYRFFIFRGSSADVLLLYFQPPYCLRVLDPVYDAGHPHLLGADFYANNPELIDPVFSREFPAFPELTIAALPFSDTTLINTGLLAKREWPEDVLGEQKPPDWCFYFEQGELARQLGDWPHVAAIGDEGLAEFEPRHASELPVFIEGYAHVGQWEKAEDLTSRALEMDASTQIMLCSTWGRIQNAFAGDPDAFELTERVQSDLACD